MYLRHLVAYEYAKKSMPPYYSVLDLGFGEGYGTAILGSYFKNVVGLEVEEKTVKHATEKYHSENFCYIIYDGLQLPFDREKFNGVTSFQVIEHIKDNVKYISEIWRVLKKGGSFILTTPNRELRLDYREKPWNRFHVKEYNNIELQMVLKKSFNNVKIFGIYGNQKLQEMEITRIKTAKMFVRIDALGLRDIVPIGIRQAISNIINQIKSPKKSNENIDYFSIEDFHVSESVEGCIDLLAVCKK